MLSVARAKNGGESKVLSVVVFVADDAELSLFSDEDDGV